MVDTPLSAYPPRVLTHVLGHDDTNQVGKMDVSNIGASVVVGTSPPSSAAENSLWWESDTGALYIYYDDGTSVQWVAIGESTGGGGGTPGGTEGQIQINESSTFGAFGYYASGTLRVVNATTPQKLEVYKTTDDNATPVDYERASIRWGGSSHNPDALIIATDRGGTGTTTRPIMIGTYSASATRPLGDAQVGVYSEGYLWLGRSGSSIGFGGSDAGNSHAWMSSNHYCMRSEMVMGWGNDNFDAWAVYSDAALGRDSAGVVEVNSGTLHAYRDFKLRALISNGVLFADLPTPVAGMQLYIIDADVNTFGASITASGAYPVLAWYNGTNWTVIGV